MTDNSVSVEMRDLRRTCETMLAAMGVSSDVRAHLQSHGLGGVQTRHYDRHSTMDEKRKALELWEEWTATLWLVQRACIVTSICTLKGLI